MTRWEYCEVEREQCLVRFYRPTGQRVVKLKIDRDKGDRNHWDATGRAIAELGMDGWELVGLPDLSGRDWVFKRPVGD